MSDPQVPPPGAPSSPSSPSSPSPSSPPPGWFWDGSVYRWWDGHAWTPHVGPAVSWVDRDDRTLSALSHAGLLAGGFLLPLVMYLISDERRRPETRYHAREALNFQLTFLAVYLVAFGGIFVGLFIGFGVFDEGSSPWPFVVMTFGLFGLFGLLFVANIVFSIMGAVRAQRGERWRYPVSIRFVRP